MKNIEIAKIANGFKEIEENNNEVFGNHTKALFSFIKNKREIDNAKTDYDKAYSSILNEFQRDKKIEPVYGDDGNIKDYKLKNDFVAEWNNRINELNQIEVDIPVTKILLADIEGCPLGIKEMESLAFMIDED